MGKYVYDINPVEHIVADAAGEPGQRTFFIQARADDELVNLVLEKQEVANLAESVLQLLDELQEKYPDIPPLSTNRETLYPEYPINETFRIGQLMVGYDEQNDMIWLIAKALVINPSGEVVDPETEEVPTVRLVATREQMRLMSEHAREIVAQGRPVCPLCDSPIDREGHFCPRTDGKAMPIVI